MTIVAAVRSAMRRTSSTTVDSSNARSASGNDKASNGSDLPGVGPNSSTRAIVIRTLDDAAGSGGSSGSSESSLDSPGGPSFLSVEDRAGPLLAAASTLDEKSK